jgi:hypothetical protein
MDRNALSEPGKEFFYSSVVEVFLQLLAVENSSWHFWILLMKFIDG